jgi:hypothetical protein
MSDYSIEQLKVHPSSREENLSQKARPPITMRFFYEQVVASTISNMLGIIIGHPLDTVKVGETLANKAIGEDADGPQTD